MILLYNWAGYQIEINIFYRQYEIKSKFKNNYCSKIYTVYTL